MALAQDIHRLTMIHTGKLSVADATAILGCKPEELLEKVMRRVGTGGKSVAEATKDNAALYMPRGEDGKGAAPKQEGGPAAADAALLNPALYRHLVATLAYAAPGALAAADLDALDAHHAAVVGHLTAAVATAREEAGDTEVLGALEDVARYHARCSGKDAALAAHDAVLALPKLSAGKKLDALLDAARVASFWGDRPRTGASLAAAEKVMATGGDWDRRNRLKAYRALSALLARDAKGASAPLAAGIATFSCTELCTYPEFVAYATLTNLLFLKRTELKKTIIDGSEVLQVAKEIPVVVRTRRTYWTVVQVNEYLLAALKIMTQLHVLTIKQHM
jgi:hypothetical protein